MSIFKAVALLFLSLSVSAGAATAYRVDIDGRLEDIELESITSDEASNARNPVWKNEKQNNYITSEGRAMLNGEWARHSFSFVPASDGIVDLVLRAANPRKRVNWAEYRNIVVHGCTASGKWRQAARYLMPDGGVRAANKLPAKQRLKVKAGAKVTVTFDVREAGRTSFPADMASTSGENRPKEYFAVDEGGTRLLPLCDKGIDPATVIPLAPELNLPPPRSAETIFPAAATLASPSTDTAKEDAIAVELLEEDGIARTVPVRIMVPLPPGKTFHPEHDSLRITAPDGTGTTVAGRIAALRPGSERGKRTCSILSAEFPAKLAAGERSTYRITLQRNRKAPMQTPLLRRTPDGYAVDTGMLTCRVDEKNFAFLQDVRIGSRLIGSFAPGGVVLRNETGERFTAKNAKLTLEYSDGNLAILHASFGLFPGDGSVADKNSAREGLWNFPYASSTGICGTNSLTSPRWSWHSVPWVKTRPSGWTA